jgi:hypothetical protein
VQALPEPLPLMKTLASFAELDGHVMETTTLPRLVVGETVEFNADIYRGEGDAVEAVAHLRGPFRVSDATLEFGDAYGELQALQRVTFHFSGSDDLRPAWRVLDRV